MTIRVAAFGLLLSFFLCSCIGFGDRYHGLLPDSERKDNFTLVASGKAEKGGASRVLEVSLHKESSQSSPIIVWKIIPNDFVSAEYFNFQLFGTPPQFTRVIYLPSRLTPDSSYWLHVKTDESANERYQKSLRDSQNHVIEVSSDVVQTTHPNRQPAE